MHFSWVFRPYEVICLSRLTITLPSFFATNHTHDDFSHFSLILSERVENRLMDLLSRIGASLKSRWWFGVISASHWLGGGVFNNVAAFEEQAKWKRTGPPRHHIPETHGGVPFFLACFGLIGGIRTKTVPFHRFCFWLTSHFFLAVIGLISKVSPSPSPTIHTAYPALTFFQSEL